VEQHVLRWFGRSNDARGHDKWKGAGLIRQSLADSCSGPNGQPMRPSRCGPYSARRRAAPTQRRRCGPARRGVWPGRQWRTVAARPDPTQRSPSRLPGLGAPTDPPTAPSLSSSLDWMSDSNQISKWTMQFHLGFYQKRSKQPTLMRIKIWKHTKYFRVRENAPNMVAVYSRYLMSIQLLMPLSWLDSW